MGAPSLTSPQKYSLQCKLSSPELPRPGSHADLATLSCTSEDCFLAWSWSVLGIFRQALVLFEWGPRMPTEHTHSDPLANAHRPVVHGQ